MRRIGVRMREIGVGKRGIGCGMRVIGGRNEGNQGENLRTEVEIMNKKCGEG